MVERGMQARIVRKNGAAMVRVGSEFAMLLRARHHEELDVGELREGLVIACHRVVVRWQVSPPETADLLEMALDSLGGDEFTDVAQRRHSLSHQLFGVFLTEPLDQRRDREPLVAAADLTAVAGARAMTG